MTSAQELLAFIVSGEEVRYNSYRTVFICYLTFSLSVFNILSLFCVFDTLIII
jgi:hypothetical protein